MFPSPEGYISPPFVSLRFGGLVLLLESREGLGPNPWGSLCSTGSGNLPLSRGCR